MNEKAFYLAVLQLIDVSSKRGCWEGSELVSVVEVRKEVINKIKVFQEKENPSESGDEDVG